MATAVIQGPQRPVLVPHKRRAFPSLSGGQGGFTGRRSYDSQDHEHAPWADAADAGACGGASGELSQVHDGEG